MFFPEGGVRASVDGRLADMRKSFVELYALQPTMIKRFTYGAARTAPMPQRLLNVAATHP